MWTNHCTEIGPRQEFSVTSLESATRVGISHFGRPVVHDSRRRQVSRIGRRPNQPTTSNGSVLPLLGKVRAHFGTRIGGFQCPRSRIFTDQNEKRHLPEIEAPIRSQRVPHFHRWRAGAGSSPSRWSSAPKSPAHSQSASFLIVCPTFAVCIVMISHFFRFCECGEERANYPL